MHANDQKICTNDHKLWEMTIKTTKFARITAKFAGIFYKKALDSVCVCHPSILILKNSNKRTALEHNFDGMFNYQPFS